jgi:TPR repeat protein
MPWTKIATGLDGAEEERARRPATLRIGRTLRLGDACGVVSHKSKEFSVPTLQNVYPVTIEARACRLTAGHGLADAQDILSGMYEFGHGVPLDYVLA